MYTKKTLSKKVSAKNEKGRAKGASFTQQRHTGCIAAMASLADIDDDEAADATAAAQPPQQQQPPTQQADTTQQQQQQQHEKQKPDDNLPQQQQLSRVRPLVIRQVVSATKGKGRIKPRRAQLEDRGSSPGGGTSLANIPRIDGA
jgi:hypothetical protein